MAKPKLNLADFTGVVTKASNTVPDAEVELSLIDVERQVRTELGDLTNLATSIAEIGVLEPILLLDKEDGRYLLIAGERRFRSALLANLTKIPALIKRGLTPFQIRQIQVTENNEREDLSAYDEAMGVSEDVEKFGVKEAQKIWNRSEGWVSKRTAVKKYSALVLELLKSGLCGDLEVLHSLNQLYALSKADFGHMERRLKEGLPLSRDEARNKVAAVKDFKRQEEEFAKRRTEVKAAAKTEKTPKLPEEQRKPDATLQTGAAVQGKTSTKATPNEPSAEEVALAERKRLEKGLTVLRQELFEWGAANTAHFNSMQTKMRELDFDMNEGEWVLWSGFLSMVLPMMDALGENRALSYLKRLQTEFKTKTPILMWREQHALQAGEDPEDAHAARDEVPNMPADWRF